MKKVILYGALTILFSALCSLYAEAATKPRLLINIVVSSLQANDLQRYSENFSTGGFSRLMSDGAYFSNATYDYMQTITPTSLATISTGAMPSTHGVVSDSWFDYVGNKRVALIDDSKEQGVDPSGASASYSPRQLIAETISEALLEHDAQSRIATIAVEPLSAIVMAGKAGEVYWMDNLQSSWTTSTFYTKTLPAWITTYNRNESNQEFMIKRWNLLLPYDSYINTQVSCVEDLKSKENKRIDFIGGVETIQSHFSDEYAQMSYTPAGNSAMLAFAKQLISKNEMGKDSSCDMLNIVLDTPRNICQRFGPESVEWEDMLYRLDRDLEDFINYARAQVIDPNEVVIVLTSDHGSSPSYNTPDHEAERFNVRQAEVITNAFLGAQYGGGEWILGIIDRAIYLNHDLIYEKGLSIADIQHDIATFVMQLRGISHAVSAEAMRNSYFGSGYGRKIQNGFYPRRSGDVILNLMPGWIVEQEGMRSMSGSMYLYDRQVPLLIFGGGIEPMRSNTEIDMTSLAVTEAQLLGVNTPSAAEGTALDI